MTLMTTTGVTKNTVMSFIKHLNDEDFTAARKCVDDDLKFDGCDGLARGADAYFNDMEKMKFKYHVIKTFAEGDDVCLLYSISTWVAPRYSPAAGTVWSTTRSFLSKWAFDPRPLLVQHKK